MKFLHHSPHYRLQLSCAVLLTLGLFFVIGGVAWAHASVIDSNPKMNSTVTLSKLPTTLTVKTAENMKPGAANSNLFVYGPSGKLISQRDATVSLNDPTQMSIAIKPDKTGVYTVHWKTISADDGDPDEGVFGFLVTSASSSTTTDSDVKGTSVWVSIITGVVGLLIGLGIGRSIGVAGKLRKA